MPNSNTPRTGTPGASTSSTPGGGNEVRSFTSDAGLGRDSSVGASGAADGDVIDVLNELIETSKDGEKGFALAAKDANDPALAGIFADGERSCREAARELQEQVRSLGGNPDDSGSVKGAVHRGWVSLKSATTTRDAKAVLEECERGRRLRQGKILRGPEARPRRRTCAPSSSASIAASSKITIACETCATNIAPDDPPGSRRVESRGAVSAALQARTATAFLAIGGNCRTPLVAQIDAAPRSCPEQHAEDLRPRSDLSDAHMHGDRAAKECGGENCAQHRCRGNRQRDGTNQHDNRESGPRARIESGLFHCLAQGRGRTNCITASSSSTATTA